MRYRNDYFRRNYYIPFIELAAFKKLKYAECGDCQHIKRYNERVSEKQYGKRYYNDYNAAYNSFYAFVFQFTV
jgi:hypothetical protein